MSDVLAKILSGNTIRALDCGARGELIQSLQPLARFVDVIGFEPDKVECDRLNQGDVTAQWASAKVFPYYLSASVGKREFNITRGPSISSFYRPSTDMSQRKPWQVQESIQVETTSLDHLFTTGELSGTYDFLKIDTQGSELEILQGAQQHVLTHLLGIETEAMFFEKYQGQPLFDDLMHYLRSAEFDLVHIELLYNHIRNKKLRESRKRAAHSNVIFLRNKTWIAKQSNITPSTIHKLLALYLIYGLVNEANEIAQDFAPDLVSVIETYIDDYTLSSWRWKVALLKQVWRTIRKPTRENRLLLAKQAVTVTDSTQQVAWEINYPLHRNS